MALLTIDQLFTPLTKEQVKQKLYDLAAGLGLPTTAWVSGAPTRVLIAILSEIYGTFLAPLLVSLAKSGFLDDAEGNWLTLLAAKVYGVTRIEATFATGEVTVTNAGAGVYAFEIGEFSVRNSTTGATYHNAAYFEINGAGAVAVDIVADVAGSAGSSGPGDIDELVVAITNVSVTNADDVLGVDAESDEDLRQRCRDRLGALSPNGPADAYRYVALTPELNGGANVNRCLVKEASGDATLTIVVAAPDGAPTGGDVTLVQAAIDAYATPDSVTATVFAAIEQALTYTVNVIVSTEAGLTTSEWQTLIKQTLVDWVRTIPIEGIRLADPPALGKVPWRSVVGVVERIQVTAGSPYYVKQASLSSEVDVTVAASKVATLELADVTVNVTQVAG